MYLNLKSNLTTYDLHFSHPLNLIIGDSSTGKTALVEALRKIKYENINTDASTIITSLEPWAVGSVPSNSLVILDTDTMSSSETVDKISKSKRDDVCFVILGRKWARRLPITMCNTFKLVEVKGLTKNVLFTDNNYT